MVTPAEQKALDHIRHEVNSTIKIYEKFTAISNKFVEEDSLRAELRKIYKGRFFVPVIKLMYYLGIEEGCDEDYILKPIDKIGYSVEVIKLYRQKYNGYRFPKLYVEKLIVSCKNKNGYDYFIPQKTTLDSILKLLIKLDMASFEASIILEGQDDVIFTPSLFRIIGDAIAT